MPATETECAFIVNESLASQQSLRAQSDNWGRLIFLDDVGGFEGECPISKRCIVFGR